jgi:hypothetical protein
VSWLQGAREDLVAEYEALHQPDRAAVYRAEIARLKAATDTTAPATPK